MTDREGMALKERIHEFARIARQLTAADRSALWILDHRNHALWTVIPNLEGSLIDLRIAIGQGYVGLVFETGEPFNIPFDLYDDPNATVIQQSDQRIGYRTCSLLCTPIVNTHQQVTGVIQVINKRGKGHFLSYDPAHWPKPPDYFKASFDAKDQQCLMELGSQIAIAI
ncbi:MAG: GAF domain-containing protein [Leptolyngbyaceae cyanobacterium bins.59]|nr:GAF domain-containing protein [Leptolyngbyaceae cyanobacterium bins.59]